MTQELVHKEEKELKKEVLNVKFQVFKAKKAVDKIDKLERTLTLHEVVLAKRSKEIEQLEKKLEKYVKHEHLNDMKSHVGRIARHEDMLFDNAKVMREIIKELTRLSDQHDSHHMEHTKKTEAHRKDHEEKVNTILAKIGKMEYELHDRMSQIDYQNRLIMKYLKQVDDKFFSKK